MHLWITAGKTSIYLGLIRDGYGRQWPPSGGLHSLFLQSYSNNMEVKVWEDACMYLFDILSRKNY